MHVNRGDGDWHAPNYGSTAFSPDPIYFRQTQYDNERMGVNSRLRSTSARTALEAGAWYESNETHIRRVAWRLKDYATSPDVDFANVLRLFFDRTGDLTTTTAVHPEHHQPDGRPAQAHVRREVPAHRRRVQEQWPHDPQRRVSA